MIKDWVGNKKTTFAILGASNHSEWDREKNDYYATDPNVILDLIHFEEFSPTNNYKYFEQESNFNVWEPACGEWHLSKELEKHWFNVKSTDLINRWYWKWWIDFLKSQDKFNWHIITNPPYKYAKEFVEKAMELIPEWKKVAMFLKLQFLEWQSRKKLFQKYPPKKVYVYSKRQMCAKNWEFEKYKSNAIAYAWYVWEKGFKWKPQIEWI